MSRGILINKSRVCWSFYSLSTFPFMTFVFTEKQAGHHGN